MRLVRAAHSAGGEQAFQDRSSDETRLAARLKIESTPSLSWYGWGWRNGEIRVRDQGKACYWATLNEHFVLNISSHDSAKGGPLKTIWEGVLVTILKGYSVTEMDTPFEGLRNQGIMQAQLERVKHMTLTHDERY
ncbi:hypothetical protein B0H13DRAFT_1895264 [Mycena leptocephala]|nr:hypothetical protein B0H13DRAFT_1895264 [Mycena leptocephala]